jgi:hypothetical protein
VKVALSRMLQLLCCLFYNFKRIARSEYAYSASLSAFAEWFPLRSNEPYCAKRIRLFRLRFRLSPNGFRFAPTSLINLCRELCRFKKTLCAPLRKKLLLLLIAALSLTLIALASKP